MGRRSLRAKPRPRRSRLASASWPSGAGGKQFRCDQMVRAAIEECRRRRTITAKQHDRASSHELPGCSRDLAAEHERSRDHAASRILAAVATDHDEAAPQPVAGARARIAMHDHDAARHAGHFAGERSTEAIARIAIDLEASALEARRREGTRIPLDMQCPCAHQPTRLLADRTLDDDLARGHVRTDKVEAFRATFEAKRHRLPHAQAEKIADLELVARAMESETRDRPL